MPDEDIIVGSGPAGLAAAHALLARGRKVRILDVGETLEPDRLDRLARMGGQSPAEWTAEDLDAARSPRRAARTDGMRPYGSDFAVRDVAELLGGAGAERASGLKPSFALGGLSNGWGAAVAPYRIEDIGDWPPEAQALASHYQAVSEFMPISSVADGLQDVLPMWRAGQGHALPLSSTAAELSKRLARREDTLRSAGVHFGQARQAVAAGCRACAMCLYGCPYKLIFNAGFALQTLQSHPGLSYEPDRRVVAFEQLDGGVRVTSFDRSGTSPIVHSGASLFLAAGVLSTARLMLAHPANSGRSFTLLDSQQMLMPMVHSWPVGGAFDLEARHTLAQMFVEILDPTVSTRSVHLQLYTWNDLFALDMRARFGRSADVLGPVIEAICRRLVVAQAFLHSDESARMSLTLEKQGGRERLLVNPIVSQSTGQALRRVQNKTGRIFAPSGIFPVPGQARIGAVGSSFHCGGSMPMRDRPSSGETDVLGRPHGLQRVHIVDASVLPSIPATTITFSVMANAHRIASTAPLPG